MSDFFVLFVAAVWLSARYYGRAGGIVATVASALAIFYFFPRADSGTPVSLWRTAAQIAAFLAIAVLITWMTSAWRENRRLLETTLSSIGDAVLATDREGYVTFLNPVAETLTGWPRKEARGKHASEILKLVQEGTHEPVENPLARALRERATVSLLDQNRLGIAQRSGMPHRAERLAHAGRIGGNARRDPGLPRYRQAAAIGGASSPTRKRWMRWGGWRAAWRAISTTC